MNANEIVDEIEKIFPDAHCELNHETPFQLLIAVVLSAQTTDASVNRVTPALFAAWPDAKSLSKAPLDQVEACLKTLGLFHTKAKNIISTASDLQERFNGVVPSSYKDLQSLAGVGRKTANVVRSVAFDIPSFAVDTHVERVSKRLGLAKVDDDVLAVEKKLKRKIDRSRWNRAHHDFIFFGRYFCMAKKPKCEECPFVPVCRKDRLDAYLKEQKEKKKKKNIDKNELDSKDPVSKDKDAKMDKTEKEKLIEEKTENTLSEIEGFVEAQSVIQSLDEKWDDEAKLIRDQAEILAKAQNAVDNAAIGKPFKPSKETEELFDQINAAVEAQNDIDNGMERVDKHLRKEIDERNDPDEWNPETVIDEKIKEEQDEQVSDDLKDEIVNAFE